MIKIILGVTQFQENTDTAGCLVVEIHMTVYTKEINYTLKIKSNFIITYLVLGGTR
jgi:hypothetical protein